MQRAAIALLQPGSMFISGTLAPAVCCLTWSDQPNLKVELHSVDTTVSNFNGFFVGDGIINYGASIFLPAGLFTCGTGQIVSLLYYPDSRLFPDSTLVTSQVGTNVLGISMPGCLDTMHLPANFTFSLPVSGTAVQSPCGYYDLSISQAWRTDGCTPVASQSNSTLITCSCSHMTNFAALVQPSIQAISVISSSLFSYKAVSAYIAIPCLTLAVVLALTELHSLRGLILINIAVCVCTGLCLYVFGVDATGQWGGCYTIAVFVHYFVLSAAIWLALFGLYQLRTVWRDLLPVPTAARACIMHCSAAYGIPLAVVGITLLVTRSDYLASNACWPSSGQ